MSSTYPDLLGNFSDPHYLRDKAILAPKNEIVDEVNSHILSILPGETKKYLSFDKICSSSNDVSKQSILYPIEFLNTLKFSRIPNHELELKGRNTCYSLEEFESKYWPLQWYKNDYYKVGK